MRYAILIIAMTLISISTSAQIVVITELNYNSPIYFNPMDWIEFYNYTDIDINLDGWVFKDDVDTHGYVFPEDALLDSGGFIILCEDTVAFKSYFPGVDCYVGNFDFGLSGGGELIRLYDDQGDLIDYLIYDDQPPWPVEPDGQGPTLELIAPWLPNTQPQNWRASLLPFGSPGLENGWVAVDPESPEKGLPTEIRLLPGFPNPFNPSTQLTFLLPKATDVSLIVFDCQGREVARLAEQRYLPGAHQIGFDAKGLSSGLYFARLVAGDEVQTDKLMLLK